MTDLIDDLTSRARDAGAREQRDLLGAALAAAKAPESLDRGWALVHLAAALRDHERLDEALDLLDLVDRRFLDPTLQRAAFTCAIAIHGDMKKLALACMLCDEQRRRMPGDVYFLRAEVRARQARFDETGDSDAAAALERAQRELQLLIGDLVVAA